MKLNYKRTFLVGLAFLSISAFWQLYDNLVPLILTSTFGMGETLRGVIMAADNVLALFLLPLFGGLSDKTNTRLGRRTPYILVGTAIAVTFMLFLPSFEQKTNLTLFLVGLGVVLLAMGSYRSPAVALMPDLTPKPLRSKANAVINLMGALGGVFTLVMVKLLIPKEDRPNYLPVFSSGAIMMVVSVLLLLLTVRVRRLSEEVTAMD
ncbi:MAG: MFS transporter, partial [Clostridia bacterium]|nr:MFS transporter [Clostridia bacterium]